MSHQSAATLTPLTCEVINVVTMAAINQEEILGSMLAVSY